MYVVIDETTGWSDESMRFATREEAEDFVEAMKLDREWLEFSIRWED